MEALAPIPSRIQRLSGAPFWVPVRSEDPISGVVDLSGGTATVAIVKGRPVTADFNSATISATSYREKDGRSYYAVEQTFPGSLPIGTYEVYVKVVDSGLTYVHRAGPISVY